MAGRQSRIRILAKGRKGEVCARPKQAPTRLVGGACVLMCLTAVFYIPAMRGEFIWDDDDYVKNNQTLRSGEGLRQIWFHIGSTPQYYPLVHTSFWIEYRLWGLHPAGYHVV